MHHDVMALFRELADLSPAEREDYYARQQVPAAVRAEVESLLRFDGNPDHSLTGHVAAVAQPAPVDIVLFKGLRKALVR